MVHFNGTLHALTVMFYGVTSIKLIAAKALLVKGR